jgi:ligand-binding sensor domain-containing protein
MYRSTCLLLAALLVLASCNAPPKPPSVEATPPTHPSATPARAQSAVLDSMVQIDQYVVEIYQDQKGNLWFGTLSRGAAKYDGKAVSYLAEKDGLCNNTVVSIAEDQAGNIWIGTHAGAARYDGKTITNYVGDKGVHGAGCKLLVDRNGGIWAGTNHGVFRFTGSEFTPFELPKPAIQDLSYKWEAGKIWNLIEDRQGNIWFARDGYGACKYDGRTFTHFTQEDGLCSNNVATIIEDRQGNLWFGSLSSDWPQYQNVGGVSRYDGKAFIRFPEVKGLSENDSYTIYEDRKGNMWLAAIGHGVYRYADGQFTLFDQSDRKDLIMNWGLQGILEDRQGRLWCGFSGGLFCLRGGVFQNVTQAGPWE